MFRPKNRSGYALPFYGLLYLDAFLLPHLMTENVRFPKKRLKFVSLRGRRAAAAILKPKAWHPAAKYGSTKRQNTQILIRRGATPHRRFSGSAISRGRKSAFHMLQHLSLARRANFTAQPRPCLVPGFRLVPSKIAASGARALLAMTRLIGFAGKRNNFRNETFVKRCRATPRKKRPHKTKNVCFPNKNAPFWCHCEAAARPRQS